MLLFAAEKAHVKLCQLLIDRGAEVQAATATGRTALHAAAAVGSLPLCRLLLDNGAATDARMKDGTTPLLMAVVGGFVELTRLFLDKGAAVDLGDSEGVTVRHRAQYHRCVLIFLFCFFFVLQPLLAAVDMGNQQLVRLLIDYGANVNVHRRTGVTPLYVAAERGRTDICRLLLLRGAGVNSGKLSQGGGTTVRHSLTVCVHCVLVLLVVESLTAVCACSCVLCSR